MGKSTAAGMLETLGVPVHDSDAAVHELLAEGGKGNEAVRGAFPYASYTQIYGRKDRFGIRSIDRSELGKIVFENSEKREKLEAIIHPLVHESQTEFIRKHKNLGSQLVILDIPLLFETGAESRVDYILTVTAPDFVQKMRVMQRPGMTEEKFAAILARQMPNGEKCARSDFVIHTGLGRAHTMKQLKEALNQIKSKESKHIA